MRISKASFLHAFTVLSCATTMIAGPSLVDRSPFVWPGFDASKKGAPSTSGASSEDFEFHAVYEQGGNFQVLLRDNRNNAFHWLMVGEEENGLRAISYDEESDELVFSYENQQKSLALKEQPGWVSTPLAAGADSTISRTVNRSSIRSTTSVNRRTVRRQTATAINSTTDRTRITPTAGRSSSPTIPTRRLPIRRQPGGDPGVSAPSFIPPSPGPAPQTEPPMESPIEAPTGTPGGRP